MGAVDVLTLHAFGGRTERFILLETAGVREPGTACSPDQSFGTEVTKQVGKNLAAPHLGDVDKVDFPKDSNTIQLSVKFSSSVHDTTVSSKEPRIAHCGRRFGEGLVMIPGAGPHGVGIPNPPTIRCGGLERNVLKLSERLPAPLRVAKPSGTRQRRTLGNAWTPMSGKISCYVLFVTSSTRALSELPSYRATVAFVLPFDTVQDSPGQKMNE
ncbi:hypothetical protein PM082_009903 [Marasmius tenuissimus]|nr:hypothetical protein PM082_009903 [Marasmius tenuissimus]